MMNSKSKTINQFEESDDHWEILRFKKNTLASVDTKYADVIKKIEGRPLKLWDEVAKKAVPFNFISEKKMDICFFK